MKPAIQKSTSAPPGGSGRTRTLRPPSSATSATAPPAPRIAPAVHQTITAFLNHAVKVHLKTTLPDALDTIGRAELRAYCRAAWDELEAEDRSSLKEFLSAWLQYILLRLQLWKRTQ